MTENLDVRILLPGDKAALMDFAKRQLAATVSDPTERELQSWNARWRGEALDHYLPQGWSFGGFANGQLQGFILAQPLLFCRGLTQTLWIEHLECVSKSVENELLDCALRWARDKHLQCLLREGPQGTWIETKSARY